MTPKFGPRRAGWIDAADGGAPLTPPELKAFETLDTAYRSLCAMLYNYAPMSGHPGGSISSEMQCSGNDGITTQVQMDGQMTSTTSTMTMTQKMNLGGQTVQTKARVTSERIGDCPA